MMHCYRFVYLGIKGIKRHIYPPGLACWRLRSLVKQIFDEMFLLYKAFIVHCFSVLCIAKIVIKPKAFSLEHSFEPELLIMCCDL